MSDTNQKKIIRCAIYTRKSHEEGLDQEFNSLDAQRDAAESYIESQKLLGWRALPDRYDDGGFSGGTMERPGLQKLLRDIDDAKVDIIVVYKIDRLSRSLLDFTQMIDSFNKKDVCFVSVTQQISTTDSTGRMMLNILMTFAQYEREVIGDRIRDKVAAAKRRGKYCGGVPILGYDIDRENKKLIVNHDEVPVVRHIFRRFSQLGSAKKMAQELNEQGYRTKSWTTKKGRARSGGEWNTSHVYRLLNNCIYIGKIAHKDRQYEGEHEGIVDLEIWKSVQKILSENKPIKVALSRAETVAPLKGVIRCGHCDSSMGPTYAKKNGRRYSYYLCERDTKRAVSQCPVRRVAAGEIESAVVHQLGAVFRSPTLVAKTFFAARELERAEIDRLEKRKNEISDELTELRQEAIELMRPECTKPDKEQKLMQVNQRAIELSRALTNVTEQKSAVTTANITERDISEAFQNIEEFWDVLYPAERNRLIRLIVEKIEVRETGIDMEVRTGGLATLITELAGLTVEIKERKS